MVMTLALSSSPAVVVATAPAVDDAPSDSLTVASRFGLLAKYEFRLS